YLGQVPKKSPSSAYSGPCRLIEHLFSFDVLYNQILTKQKFFAHISRFIVNQNPLPHSSTSFDRSDFKNNPRTKELLTLISRPLTLVLKRQNENSDLVSRFLADVLSDVRLPNSRDTKENDEIEMRNQLLVLGVASEFIDRIKASNPDPSFINSIFRKLFNLAPCNAYKGLSVLLINYLIETIENSNAFKTLSPESVLASISILSDSLLSALRRSTIASLFSGPLSSIYQPVSLSMLQDEIKYDFESAIYSHKETNMDIDDPSSCSYTSLWSHQWKYSFMTLLDTVLPKLCNFLYRSRKRVILSEENAKDIALIHYALKFVYTASPDQMLPLNSIFSSWDQFLLVLRESIVNFKSFNAQQATGVLGVLTSLQSPVSSLQELDSSIDRRNVKLDEFLALITCFCDCLRHHLLHLTDEEIAQSKCSPYNLSQLISIGNSICDFMCGLIDISHPHQTPSMTNWYPMQLPNEDQQQRTS
ncbi:hypothetical protein Ciccas_012798, partial [Cichlidogyrus casuarinus]